MKIISFEGFEYSGKSTQIKLLQNYFKKNKIKSSFTREPGGNKKLEKIRKIILQSDFDNLSLILFFFAIFSNSFDLPDWPNRFTKIIAFVFFVIFLITLSGERLKSSWETSANMGMQFACKIEVAVACIV